MAANIETSEGQSAGGAAGSDEKSDQQIRTILENLQRVSPQRTPAEEDNLILGTNHDHEEPNAIQHRLVAIENQTKKRSSRGFTRYLVAICIGVAATLAWQSYGEAAKQLFAAKAPELGWSSETKQMIASWVQTKPPAGPEGTAVRPSLPAQVATVAQTVPAAVVPKAPAAPSIDPEQVHHMAVDLAALGQTVDQLAASQDQMVHQIDTLQTSNQEILASNREILEKIPAPSPPPPTVAPTHKPTTRTPPSSRAPIPPR